MSVCVDTDFKLEIQTFNAHLLYKNLILKEGCNDIFVPMYT